MPDAAPVPGPLRSDGAEEDRDEEDQVYGLLTVAGTQVALPLSALREVVPCPSAFSPLPVSALGLLGAMELRELVVPVVDLGQRLGLSTARTRGGDGRGTGGLDEEVVVVVADGDQLLGVLAQAVRGVVRVAASALVDLRAEDGPLLVSQAFHGDDGSIVSVIDPARVVSLPGVPTVRDRPRAPITAGGAGRGPGAGGRTTWSLLLCGDRLLALDVAFVHTTLPGTPPRPSVVGGGLCLGVRAYAGLDVPVVDPLRLLGIGSTDAPEGDDEHRSGDDAGLVLRLGDGYVVLALSALVGLVDVSASDSMALPAFSVPRPDLLAGLADLPDHGPCLVLDGDALLADTGLRELAATNVASVGPDAAGPATPSTAPPSSGAVAPPAHAPMYLTYRAGTALATRLEQVAEILPLPPAQALVAAPRGGVHEAVVAVTAHRGTSLPILHLPTLLGTASRTSAGDLRGGCLLLVAVEGGHVAFAVDTLHEIEPLTWVDPAAERTDAPAASAQVLRTSRLIQVGTSDTLLRDLDLASLAAAVRGG